MNGILASILPFMLTILQNMSLLCSHHLKSCLGAEQFFLSTLRWIVTDMIARYSQDDDSQAIKTITNRRMENLKEAKENIKKAQAKQKEIYDKTYAKPNAFAVGEKVLMKDNLRKKRAGGNCIPGILGLM